VLQNQHKFTKLLITKKMQSSAKYFFGGIFILHQFTDNNSVDPASRPAKKTRFVSRLC